ncbi:hypothetical protein SUDANB145_05585 [Streptomyces sp. enrichment culture]
MHLRNQLRARATDSGTGGRVIIPSRGDSSQG